MSKKLSDFFTLLGFALFVLLVGFLSSWFSGMNIVKDIYFYLNKPSFAPPGWIFAPVWTILYIFIGISAFLVWKKKDEKNINPAIAVFFIQLFLNYIWSIIFFGRGNYGLAFFDIIALWIAITVMIVIFYKISKPAAWLLIPYWLWVTFASALNYFVWTLN
ncbi:MAG: TspO/MBR family protein [Candidatus Paceibacterota bacterium]